MSFDNSKDILVAWKKQGKSGKPFFSGKFTWGGVTKEVVIFIGNGGDDNKPYIKMVESEPFEKEQAKQEIEVENIPFN